MVTLNPYEPPVADKLIRRLGYEHPVMDQLAIDAQQRLPGIQGQDRVWFCGAWCGYGFHEDGLKSALAVVRDFDVPIPWAIHEHA
jgi:predicted NAD/FAD-binding protein